MSLNQASCELRTLARERMRHNQLPAIAPNCIWAGHGSSAVCSLCDHPIGVNEIEYEVAPDHHTSGPLRFHLRCHAAWQSEIAAAAGSWEESEV